MADYDFEAPSFSLGLDLDLHSEPQPISQPEPFFQPAKRSSTAANLRTIEEDNDDFESPARVPYQSRAFKRLRRGPMVRLTPRPERWSLSMSGSISINDDTSRGDVYMSTLYVESGTLPGNSGCSSSKPSLHGQRIVTTESGSQWKSRKGKEVSSASASVNVEKNGSNLIFPKLTVSPLRRFQLIDSDSDDPSMIEDPGKEMPHGILSPKDKQSNCSKHADFSSMGTKRASVGKYQNEDLWKDFCSEKSSHIPTPAFDEVIEEYFTNAKNKRKPENECKDTYNETKWDEASLPPAHCYFFHKDSRIRNLVHDRLPYFFPLGAGNNQEYKQQNVSVIDYMGQFGHEVTGLTDRRRNVVKSPTRSKISVKKSQVDRISQDSGSWVNPRSCAGVQKNAGSRRVQAVSKSAGHWYTGSDGQRVYVNKNGQELTGQIAYRHYKKESGKVFKNSQKKTAAKKKTGAAKKSVPKKK
ncbi:hypothetical protein DH2020_041674 [Rehmannia glutinosa]|uniref:Uncharacterized protein n=1 Tax=Rehmannia glutinosa TaxID=99300 RepID=A0ABR0UPH1_REHGL